MEGAHPLCTLSTDKVTRGRNNVDNVSILYVSTCSQLLKFDELSLLVKSHNPDIVSVVESRLCADTPDTEICIHGYSLFSNNGNQRSGGVSMYR